MLQIYEVSQINEYLKLRFEEDAFLSAVLIRGELSNYKVYPSGHHYFSLKDANGAIRCVMFKGNSLRLRFHPQNGMKVIASGRISVYPRDGAYQLYCSELIPDGIGDLHIAFEQLKNKLQAEGLFAMERKRPIPAFPHTIAIITSSAGAALRDMLRILRKRYPLSKVKLLAVRVQGTEAPGEIADAIEYANRHQVADLIITGRGGGSMEDLWAFNDPTVAYAIAASRIPVISAVGHEPDVTISDFVADLRAATPSNAAELAVPDQLELRQRLHSTQTMLMTLISKRLKIERQRLTSLQNSRFLKNPETYINERQQYLDHMHRRFGAASAALLNQKKQQFISLTAKLDAMSPLKVLSRGYSMTMDPSGKLIRSIKQVKPGESIQVQFFDGSATTTILEVKHEQKINEL